jgi:NADPH2:quinone reductase
VALLSVVRERDLDRVDGAVAHGVALNEAQPGEAIRAYAPEGVHRIIEVAFSENADLDAEVAAPTPSSPKHTTGSTPGRASAYFWPSQPDTRNARRHARAAAASGLR